MTRITYPRVKTFSKLVFPQAPSPLKERKYVSNDPLLPNVFISPSVQYSHRIFLKRYMQKDYMTRHLRTYRSTSLRWTVFVPPQSGMFRKADGRFIYIQL